MMNECVVGGTSQIMERGCALLGYAPIGNIGMLLLATRLRNAATLPGGHIIRLVTESRWLQLPLQVIFLPKLFTQDVRDCTKGFTCNVRH
jgi:hypothetical protein